MTFLLIRHRSPYFSACTFITYERSSDSACDLGRAVLYCVGPFMCVVNFKFPLWRFSFRQTQRYKKHTIGFARAVTRFLNTMSGTTMVPPDDFVSMAINLLSVRKSLPSLTDSYLGRNSPCHKECFAPAGIFPLKLLCLTIFSHGDKITLRKSMVNSSKESNDLHIAPLCHIVLGIALKHSARKQKGKK